MMYWKYCSKIIDINGLKVIRADDIILIDNFVFQYVYVHKNDASLKLIITPEIIKIISANPDLVQAAMELALNLKPQMNGLIHINMWFSVENIFLQETEKILNRFKSNSPGMHVPPYETFIKNCISLASCPFTSKDEKIMVNEIVKLHNSKQARRRFLKSRRAEFNGQRKDLTIALIDKQGYICNHPDCIEVEDLTIDHIFPLSKGGNDDLDNLQFLCRSHNSQKGTQI